MLICICNFLKGFSSFRQQPKQTNRAHNSSTWFDQYGQRQLVGPVRSCGSLARQEEEDKAKDTRAQGHARARMGRNVRIRRGNVHRGSFENTRHRGQERQVAFLARENIHGRVLDFTRGHV